MKKHILKYLIALNFLILAMPFFQTCSNDSIVIEEAEKNLHNKKMHTPSQTTEKDRADAIEKSQQESTINGYQLFYDSISKFNFTSEDISTIPFLVAPLLNLILFVFCFAKKQKLIMVFSVLQLLSTISGLIILFFISEDILQVKCGMYLLVINSSIIFYLSVKTFLIVRSQRNPTLEY